MTSCDTTGLQDSDPQGARFDGWAARPPSGPWAYVLDQPGIKYRRGLVAQKLRPGWWPFAHADPDREQAARHPQHGPAIAPECGAAGVRLSPDSAYYAWRNEHVLAWADPRVPHLAHAQLTLWVRPQGSGGVTVTCGVRLDLAAATTATLTGAGWPADLTAQAETKAAKLRAFLAAAIAERDSAAGPLLPRTAFDRWLAAKAIRAELVRTYCQDHGLAFETGELTDDQYRVGGTWMSAAAVAANHLPGLFSDSWEAAGFHHGTPAEEDR